MFLLKVVVLKLLGRWLPAEVSVSKDGKAKFESYINNLHPETHKELYGTLEGWNRALCFLPCSCLSFHSEILSRFIPMWNRVLTDLRVPRPRRHEQNMSEDVLYGERPKVGLCVGCFFGFDWLEKVGSDEDEDQAWDDWHENRRAKVKQEVGKYKVWNRPRHFLWRFFNSGTAS